ncbi:MAG: hydroxymethylglutaryl-CoA synthase [Chloroflexota bacterium]|nr:hydroxymethylglutaryl-CoA synthase [Chloroflexota bacterium]
MAVVMKPVRDVGIVGYGAYVPRYRLPSEEVGRVWHGEEGRTPITEKSVPGLDEDTATMSIEAARNALRRGRIDPAEIAAVWVGSESHPYAVKPTSVIVAQAIGATPRTLGGDWEFACKAGTEAMQAGLALVGSGMGHYALAIGMDTAQGRPGDVLEYTAAAGGAAYLLGPAEESLAILEGSFSYATDTPDFWRRPYQRYPQHRGRFTGQPAYFLHSQAAAEGLMEDLGYSPQDFDFAVFHQPNVRFPVRIAATLGFSREQIEPGLLADDIGNVYAGSSLLGLSATLDVAEAGQRILHVSFGSGAGSDAFCWRVTDRITSHMERVPRTQDYLDRRCEIDYGTYVRYRKKLRMH